MGIFDIFKKRPTEVTAERPTEVTAASHRQSPARSHSLRQRSYQAAETDRIMGNWTTVCLPADSLLQSRLRILRARSRDLAINDDYAKRFLHMIKTNVIGHQGIRLQAQVRDAKGQADTATNDLLEREFKAWGKLGSCTVCGKYSWIDAQKLFLETMARDGECLVRKIRGWKGNPYRFALEFIDTDHLLESYNRAKSANQNEIRLGVEYNAWGRPVAYHIAKSHPYAHGFESVMSGGDQVQRIPAGDIIHGFLPDRVNQGRGVPWMAQSMTRLKMLQRYETSEVIASTIAASKMGFYKTPSGDEYTAEEDGDQAQKEVISESEPGTFEELPAGWEVEAWDPQHPAAAYEAFVLAVLRGISSGLNVSYCSLANDLRSVSYSSIRQGALDERDHFRSLQTYMIEHFCDDIYQGWLSMALTAGKLGLPMARFSDFASPVFRPRGWAWVDPLKEIKSNVQSVESGVKSLQDVASETSGRDLEEVFAALQQEKQLAAKFGLDLQILKGGSKNGKPASADDIADAIGQAAD